MEENNVIERLTHEELTEIRNRAEKATEGPWIYVTDKSGLNVVAIVDEEHWDVLSRKGVSVDNAMFITSAREDIPKLLSEIERLQADVKRWKREAIEYNIDAFGWTDELNRELEALSDDGQAPEA